MPNGVAHLDVSKDLRRNYKMHEIEYLNLVLTTTIMIKRCSVGERDGEVVILLIQ